MKQSGIRFHMKSMKGVMIYLFSAYFMFLMYIFVRQEPMTTSRMKAVIGFLVLWLVLSVFSMLEHPIVQNFLKKNSKWFHIPFLILAPFFSFLMTEVMVGNYNLKMFQSYGFYNIIWYFVIYYMIYTVIGSVRYTMLAGNLLIYVAAMVNYLVYLFRGNPILPSDILAWQTGMSVASNYDLVFSTDFIIATILMYTMYVLGAKLHKVGKRPSVLNRIIVIGTFVVTTAFVFHIFFETDLIRKKIRVIDFFAPKYTYSDYGTAFGFIANAWSMSTDPPEGYSLDQVRQALQKASVHEASASESSEINKKKPNIIAIMNEAFSDLSMLGDYETNQDYLPFIRSLEENTTKGTLYVSVFGGATSDTEYEFLTGNSMAVMPSNCVPYQQFVTESTDSLAATLKAQGYHNIAIHPYAPSGYKRDLVYPLLGFDKFLSMNDFKNPELVRTYISDRESYKKIIEEYEKKSDEEPLFVFNVTMQNHGGYSGDRIFSEEETVRLTKELGYQRVEQYLSLLRESDKAFQSLIEYFSKEEEPTIIVMFGDHQPVVYSDFYNNMVDQNKVNELKYQVPFLLWANYDITEDDVDKMSANYLSSYLLKTAGLQGTTYNNYLMNLYEDIPVINGLYYMDKEGVFHRHTDPSKYYDRITEYRYIGYNNALDKKDKQKEFFLIDKE